jgi:hypothetical protein
MNVLRAYFHETNAFQRQLDLLAAVTLPLVCALVVLAVEYLGA